jgi:hypothetical protein
MLETLIDAGPDREDHAPYPQIRSCCVPAVCLAVFSYNVIYHQGPLHSCMVSDFCIMLYILCPSRLSKTMYRVYSNEPMQRVSNQSTEQTKAHMPATLQAKDLPNRKPQHLAFKSHPLSLTLAANTRVAPSKAEVEAQTCGAT